MFGVNLAFTGFLRRVVRLALVISLMHALHSGYLNLGAVLRWKRMGWVRSSLVPRVITANNVKAKIEDGTEIPIHVTTQAATAGTSADATL